MRRDGHERRGVNNILRHRWQAQRPLKPRWLANEILSRGALHLDDLATHVESVSFHCRQTDRRRRVQSPGPVERCNRRKRTHHPTKLEIPVYVYYNDDACIEFHMNRDLTLGKAMEMAEHPGCAERHFRTTSISIELCSKQQHDRDSSNEQS